MANLEIYFGDNPEQDKYFVSKLKELYPDYGDSADSLLTSTGPVKLEVPDEDVEILSEYWNNPQPIIQEQAGFADTMGSVAKSVAGGLIGMPEAVLSSPENMKKFAFEGVAPFLGVSGEQLAEKQTFGDRPIATAAIGTAIDTASEIMSPVGQALNIVGGPAVKAVGKVAGKVAPIVTEQFKENVGMIGDVAAKTNVGKKMRDIIASSTLGLEGWFSKMRGLPEDLYAKIVDVTRKKKFVGGQTEQLAKSVAKLIPDEIVPQAQTVLENKEIRLAVDKYLYGNADELSNTEAKIAQNLIGGKDKEWREIIMPAIDNARKAIDDRSAEILDEGVRAGVVSDELANTIRENMGAYFPRFYEMFEDPAAKHIIEKAGKLQTADFKQYITNRANGLLKDIDAIASPKQKQALNDIINLANAGDEDAAKVVAALSDTLESAAKGQDVTAMAGTLRGGKERLMTRKADLALQSILGKQVPVGYSLFKGATDVDALVKHAKVINILAESPYVKFPSGLEAAEALPANYVALKGAKYGRLDGSYVPQSFKRELDGYFNTITSGKNIEGMVGKVFRNSLKANTIWKAGKTVYSTFDTTARNFSSGIPMLDISGTSFAKIPYLTAKVIRNHAADSPAWKAAMEEGLADNTFASVEFGRASKMLSNSGKSWEEAFFNGMGNFFDGWKNFYSKSDAYFKLLKYFDEVDKGKSFKEAAEIARETMINYEEVAPALDILRKLPLGVPFITFSSKMIPQQVKAMVERPMTVYKWFAAADHWNKLRAEQLGISQEDINTMKEKKGLDRFLIIGKDEDNNPKLINLTFMLPLVGSPEEALQSITSFGGVGGNVVRGINAMTDPTVTDPYSGMPIVSGEASKEIDIARYIARGLAPSMIGVPQSPQSSQAYSMWATGKENVNPILDMLYGPQIATQGKMTLPEYISGRLGVKIQTQEVNKIRAQLNRQLTKADDELSKQLFRIAQERAGKAPTNISNEKERRAFEVRERRKNEYEALQKYLRENRGTILEEMVKQATKAYRGKDE